MNELNGKDTEATLFSMIERVENTKTKFIEGSAQYSLQRNRLKALRIGVSLISDHTKPEYSDPNYSIQDLIDAQAPIESLISKSEKAIQKLVLGSWQHTMLTKNIEALHNVLPLLKKEITDRNRYDQPQP
jgi:hypothetical protein